MIISKLKWNINTFSSHIVLVNGFKKVDLDVYIPYEHEFLEGMWPDGFLIGTASASYQIEGAWNESGIII